MADGVCGIDIGGTGHRVAVASQRAVVADRPGGVQVTVDGLELGRVFAGMDELVSRLAAEAGVDRVVAAGIGLTGVMTLADPVALHERFARACQTGRLVLASDAVTTHAGALGGEAGAVIAAGTGVVALGSDLDTIWHKVDGWGHLLGDCGGGAWIGARALQVAFAHEDGRDGGSASLAEAAREQFGSPSDVVRDLHTRADRAGALASFVPRVLDAAADDPIASAILVDAGRELARTADAALADGLPARLAWTGGVLRAAAPVRDAFVADLRRRRPDALIEQAGGSSVDGALALARLLYAGELRDNPPFLTTHG